MTTLSPYSDQAVPSAGPGLLAEELSFYDANKDAFVRDHLNRHLLIKGRELISVHENESAAIAEGVRRFGTEPFLVRLAGEDTPVFSVPALALGIPLCLS